MRFELRLMTAGALLLLLIAATCQQQAIAEVLPLLGTDHSSMPEVLCPPNVGVRVSVEAQ